MGRDFTQLLPEDVLLACFPLDTNGRRPHALRLVCTRWRRTFDDTPCHSKFDVHFSSYESRRLAELHGTSGDINSSPAGGNSKLGFTQRSRFLTVAEIDTSGLVSLAHKRAGVARSALIGVGHVPGVLQAARQLTGLTQLHLSSNRTYGPLGWSYDTPSYGQLFAQHSLQLGGLTRLQRLQLGVEDVQAPTCLQLSELTTLTSLTVQTIVGGQVPGELWQACAAMPRLAQLSLGVHPGDAGACMVGGDGGWDQLAACTQLMSLTVEPGLLDGMYQDDAGVELCPGITALSSLRTLRVYGEVKGLGDIWHHTGLTRLSLELRHSDDHMPHLPADVDMPALRELELSGWLVPELVPPQLLALTGLTSLHMAVDESCEAELPLLHKLHQMPHLAILLLCSHDLPDVPDTVRDLTTLRVLDLSNSSLSQLSAGPYLRNLRTLLLSDTQLTELPPALSECRRLEVLDISQRPIYSHTQLTTQMVLGTDDVALLGQLRTLRLLCVPGNATGAGFSDEVIARSNLMIAVLISAVLPSLALITGGVVSQALLLPDDEVDMAAVQTLLGEQQPLFAPFVQAVGTDLGRLRAFADNAPNTAA